MTYTIGVDLGKKGGWVMIDEHKEIYTYQANEIPPRMDLHPCITYVEEPLKYRRGTNVKALTDMWKSYGILIGTYEERNLEYIPVTYHSWARVMLGGGKYSAATRCRDLWPGAPYIAAHEGLADAALIAYYGSMLEAKKSG